MPNAIRRIVTGHDAQGRSVLVSVGAPPQFHAGAKRGVELHEIWNTAGAPALITSAVEHEPNERPLAVPPDPSGTIIRFVDYHPGHVEMLPPREDGRHPNMHRTRSIDYGIMLEGELYMIMDDQEIKLVPGDVVIQRGTDHGWANRTQEIARMAFILIDGEFSDELLTKLPKEMELTVKPVSERA